jgi:2-oxoisovalerate dehydrogenase E1 component
MNPELSASGAGKKIEPFERDREGKPLLENSDSIYAFGMLIRGLESALLDLFGKGQLSGTTHTCLGQECCQIAVVRALSDPEDAVLSNHRNHGHFLTYSGNFRGLLAEIMGREGGVCCGMGGSQHLAYRNFHSNGVQAGMTGIGVGQALARKLRGSSGIVAVIVGDGTTGEGLLYESMNLASIWKAPVLFVLENNGIAQTTPTDQTIGGDLEARGAAFGLRTWRLNDASPSLFADAEAVVSEVRQSRAPGLLVIDTERLGPHSKGDDLRSPECMAAIRDRDPLVRLGDGLPAARRLEIDVSVRDYLRGEIEWAERQPEAVRLPVLRPVDTKPRPNSAGRESSGNVRAVLNRALDAMLAANSECLLLGEDLHDPYGGAFKVTAGLSSKYPGRVLSTPISEAGVTGAAIGLALAGFRPIVEIMFADFLTLAMDQLYNHAAKFPGMYPDAEVPLLVRTPSGGRRGYGPTHSQSPENLACSVPGLTVLFPSHRHDVGSILERAVLDWPFPKICFEHKLLYGLKCDPLDYRELAPHPQDPGAAHFTTLARGSPDPDLTVVTYGYSVTLAEELAARLAGEELAVEIVVPSLLSPLPIKTLLTQLIKRERILVLEEGATDFGFGAEIGAVLAGSGYRGRFKRMGTARQPIPAARSLESQVFPGIDALMSAVLDLLFSTS